MSEFGKFDVLVARAWDIFHRTEDSGYGVVVQPSIPILFFGNSAKYFASSLKVITVGKNPSNIEFDGPDPFHRFPRARIIADGLSSLGGYINALDDYFKTEPYRKWFNCYEPLLKGLGVSYYEDQVAKGTVLHTDICSPLATRPTWSELGATIQRALWNDGHELWHDLIRALEPDVIVASVPKQYAMGIQFSRSGPPRELFTIDRTPPYIVTIEDIEVTPSRRSWLVKGNAAQTPLGKVSNVDKRRIGEALRKALDA
jgi:hypothetical protein